MHLKASIDIVRWFTFQACAFRGHDESVGSRNRGNFLEMIKLLVSYNKEIDEVVLMSLKMQDTLHPLSKKIFYMSLLRRWNMKFVKRLVMQNFV